MNTLLLLFNYFLFITCAYVAAEATDVSNYESAAMFHRVKRNAYWLKLTYDQRLAFIQKHNDYRRNVDPPATDMRFMVWSYDYEESAQYEAQKCDGHKSGFSGAERTAKVNDVNQDPASAVDIWYNESAHYTYNYNNCTKGETCADYQCLVWARNVMVGCGFKNCTTTDPGFLQIYCHYDIGFYPETQPYRAGTVPNCRWNTVYSSSENMCVTKNKCSHNKCPAGTKLDKYCICKPEATTVEFEVTTEASSCGNKTCENGEKLGENCKCYCPEDATCDSNDDRRDETSNCGNKTCENGEKLGNSCKCYCPEGTTCDSNDGRRNGTSNCGNKTCENGKKLDENCKCYCPEGTTCDSNDARRNETIGCESKKCENGEVCDENGLCYCPDGATCGTKDDKRNGAVDMKLPAAYVYVAVCVLAIFG